MKDGSGPNHRAVLGLAATALVLLLGVLLLGSTVADAAHPAKGKTYSGEISRIFGGKVVDTFAISFKVSASGKKVSQFNLPEDYPVYCQGGGFGTTQAATATITSKGTFKAKLPIYFEPTKDYEGFVIVSGKFGAKKKVSGTVKTDFTKSATCNGTSKYTAKA